MLLLVVGIIPPLRASRHLVMIATLVATLIAQIAILRHPIGSVLMNTYVADRTSALWGILFVAATALAWLFSVHYYRDDRPFQAEHDFLMLVTPLGMTLMAGAQDLIVFFIGLETLSIPLYALAAFRRNNARSMNPCAATGSSDPGRRNRLMYWDASICHGLDRNSRSNNAGCGAFKIANWVIASGRLMAQAQATTPPQS